jgi:hypothetical protein
MKGKGYDHSSLTRIRERYGVERCQAAGLVWGKELYFVGTKVEANASLDSVKPRFAVEAHMANLFGTHTEEAGDQSSQEEVASDGQESSGTPKPLPTLLSQEEQATLAQQNDARHVDRTTGSTRSPGEAAMLLTHG